MIASFSVSGLVPISAAIAGSEVAMTVAVHVLHEQGGGDDERDQALFVHRNRGAGQGRQARGLYHPLVTQAIAEPAKPPKSSVTLVCTSGAGERTMIYVLAALLPPLGLLFNGQPFSAIFNLVLIVFCLIFGLIFHVLLLVPSAHAILRST